MMIVRVAISTKVSASPRTIRPKKSYMPMLQDSLPEFSFDFLLLTFSAKGITLNNCLESGLLVDKTNLLD